MRALLVLLLAIGAGASSAAAPPAAPARGAGEALLAADAAFFAPPDLKRQLVKHRARLMQGVAAAAAADDGSLGKAAHRAAAVRAARTVVARIRAHEKFAEVAYEIGALVHECAAIGGLPDAPPRRASFEGFPTDPFRDPEKLLDVHDAAERWNAALTRATRLIAWLWKGAGGDASIALSMPAAKGPYAVREQ